MKKKFFGILLLLFVVVGLTACGTKSNKKKDIHKDGTAEDLIALMLDSYKTGDVKKFNEVLPDFMEIKTTDEEFKGQISSLYGEVQETSYNITNKKKESDEWLKQNNEYIKNIYQSDKEMTECYQLEGTVTIKGTKNEKTDNLEEVWYCKIDDKWYLIFG